MLRTIRRHSGYLLALLICWLVYAGPLVFTPGHLFLSNTFSMDLPIRLYAARSMLAGVFPFWCPDISCGFPVFAEGQAGILYPFFSIYLLSPTPAGHDLFMAVHYLLAGLFM